MLRFLRQHPAVRITLIYAVFAAAWLGYFGFMAPFAHDDPGWHRLLHHYQLVAFAAITACLFYLLVREELDRRRRIEQALEASERRFATLARLTPVGIFRSDAQGNIVYTNEAWERLVGLAGPETLGQRWQEVVHPDDRERAVAAWAAARREKRSWHDTIRLRRPDGAIRWVQVDAQPEGAGADADQVGAVTDITEAKLGEIALRASEERYRSLIEHIPAVTFTAKLDERSSSVFISPQIRDMLGFTVAEWLNEPDRWWRQVHPEDRERAVRELHDFSRDHVHSEFRIYHRDGRLLWAVDEASFLRDDAGRPVLLHGLMFDVTQAKELELALQRSNRRYETLVNSVDGIVWEMDVATFSHTFVSRQAERILGYHAERWLLEPRFWLSHVHPEDAARVEAHYRRVVEQGHAPAVEYRLRGAGDREVWVRDAVMAVAEDAGPARTLRGVMVDIGERKRVELELAALNTELEGRVAERTAEIQAVVDELRSFSYSVSHDLRAPLRAIEGFAQALEREYRGALDATGRDYLHRVLAAAQRMTQLIEDLLTLSRVTRAEMHPEAVDLSAMARETLDDLRRQDPLRQVDARIEPGLTAVGDARLLRVLIENLLGNAWKFTSRKLTARIEFGALRAAEGRRTFFVRDDGAGFDMEFVGKLFAPFQRLHRTTEFPGTGIGLATVGRIVQRHGGRVWAEGREGEGATFYFQL